MEAPFVSYPTNHRSIETIHTFDEASTNLCILQFVSNLLKVVGNHTYLLQPLQTQLAKPVRLAAEAWFDHPVLSAKQSTNVSIHL